MPVNRFRPRTTLRMDALEDRVTPAQFNVPWADPTHLTVSFAPDGTPALSAPSNLFTTLDAQMPRATWRAVLLHAIQTWSEVAGVNGGVTADGGQPFGTNGPSQGDSRFGDIRFGAVPMASELAVAIPPDPTLAGTLAGDIYLNSRATFTPESLYSVALHEVGHALGIPSNAIPTSVMYDTFNNNVTLSASDIAAVRSLYGARPADSHEGATGNNTIQTSTRIKYDSSFNGSTPLVIYGDVTTATDVDVYYLPVLDTYSGAMTVRLQTTGVSLVAPKLSVMDPKGNVIATASGTGSEGDTIALTLPQVSAGGKYYVKVEAAPGATFAVGRYGLAVTFDGLLQPSVLSLDAVLQGPYDTLAPRDISTLFQNPSGSIFNDDGHTNDTIGTATLLTTTPGFAPNANFKITASIATATDVDFYHIKAPSTQNNATLVLTAIVRAVAPNGAQERIELYDSRQVRIPATILANGNGTFTVQAVGVSANTDYYIRVGGGTVGNYQLDVTFGSKATVVSTFSTGTVPVGGQLSAALYLAQSQVFGFTLAATGPTGTPVQMTITAATGQVVFTLVGQAGDTLSGVTGFLAPGEYHVQISAIGATAPVAFRIRGSAFTDPIGPQPIDSTTGPQYQDPLNPDAFLYPDGTHTFNPFLFALFSVV